MTHISIKYKIRYKYKKEFDPMPSIDSLVDKSDE